ncbi:hypothetical protein C4585_02595 [Candidatus Parcubacteria bacterium]|nr:MAG: hypothetical protein C4585_02595 [Candidatus Parcubacteria bacterium]
MEAEKELERLYNQYLELEASGDEAGMKAFVKEEMPKLPEELRKKIMMRMFIGAMEDEVDERDTITEIQEKGIEAIEKLDKLEKDLETDESH